MPTSPPGARSTSTWHSASPRSLRHLTPTDHPAVFIVGSGRPAGDGRVAGLVIGDNGSRFRKTD
jgi:hypothetical protein